MLLSKNDYEKLPRFINHQSARLFFKAHYGRNFAMVGQERRNGLKVYIYHLVHDVHAYLEIKQSPNSSAAPQLEFHNSYQLIEITEYGHVRLADH